MTTTDHLIDVTPPACNLFATMGEMNGPPVLFLNSQANPAQLLGLVHGRCRELRMLANLASSGNSAECELREVAEHIWAGLDAVIFTLEALSKRMGESPATP